MITGGIFFLSQKELHLSDGFGIIKEQSLDCLVEAAGREAPLIDWVYNSFE